MSKTEIKTESKTDVEKDDIPVSHKSGYKRANEAHQEEKINK